jgi:ubiquinone/menaquinone biosynthesis C-methylase UbiE
MATVFMRWLERRPETYERGIRLLTLGRLESLYATIASHIKPGQRVLEIGCGTGALTVHLARRTDKIDAIDVSADMLAVARQKLSEQDLFERVQLSRMDALNLGSHYEPGSFDLIVSSLAFSEFSSPAQEYVMRLCRHLLKPGGALLILDEVQPAATITRLLSGLVRGPLRLITWLLTRTTTNPLKDIEQKLNRSGFDGQPMANVLGGSLVIYKGYGKVSSHPDQAPKQIIRLAHQPNLATFLSDVWAAFFRVLPPYPKFEPGLYAIGNPTEEAPILVTGNYDLTIRRVVKVTDKKLDAWLLVVDSSGINVWCGAGGGFLTADRVIGALKMSGAEDWHASKRMVLPQLCANGVDGNVIRDQTGWQVCWGPVRARDIPAYIDNNFEKTDRMRNVEFPMRDRLEMVSATLGLYGLMILIPVLIFWPHLFWPVLIALLGISYFYALALPLIPGRDGLIKSLPLALIAFAGMFAYTALTGSLEPSLLFKRGIGMAALSIFVAAEMQGMSPLMRGEQANWGWEAVIAIILGGLYWFLPQLMGWSG